MQITSSLLSNLLDVVEEVQLARIEIRNLVDAKFYSHSGKQVFHTLKYYFFEFNSHFSFELNPPLYTK